MRAGELWAVNRKNLKPTSRGGFEGMARSERRNLARAYAAAEWRKVRMPLQERKVSQ
jgi:hypothetical protein